MRLKTISCYNCKSDKSRLYAKENGFNLVKCQNCGLLYVNPRPENDEIAKAATTGIHKGEKEFDKTHSFTDKKVDRYLNILRDFYSKDELAGKSWLDIGCGHGEFLVALNHYSGGKIRAKGFELNQFKIESAVKRGLDVSPANPGSNEEKYDGISLLDVFSHLPDPIDDLQNWKSLIHNHGTLLIETGHSSHLPKRFHNKPYELPDHLSFANKKIVTQIIEKVGLKVLQIKIYRGVFYRDPSFVNFSKELAKLLLNRRNTFHSFFPFFQHGDMYIKAQKK
jgi:SAM-dependent methyltransferase